MNTTLESNIALWQERIGNASARWGGAEICAVTKTVDVDTINRARAAGLRTMGENRVQELLSKIDRLDPGWQIHLIGQLQTNKVKSIVGRVAMVQSLDRAALVQVNIARESQKAGIDEDELVEFLKRCGALPGLRVEGLMAIMPLVDDPEDVRLYFRRMRQWFERLRDADLPNVRMNVLSMGMSGDCIVAAEEGATMVRLGRALFGARPAKTELIQGV